MDPGEFLVAAQLTSLYPSSQITAIPIQTARQHAPLPRAIDPAGTPVEHATYSTTLYETLAGTVILRVLHQGLILELLSLSTEIRPFRFVFPSPVLEYPAIFLWNRSEIHVVAVTQIGSIYRLVLPIDEGKLWTQAIRPNWCREYFIKNITGTVEGLVHVQGAHCVVIGQKNGSLLRIESESLGDERRDDVWVESVLQHTSFLHTLASFLPTLQPTSSYDSEIISMTTVPPPTEIGYIWTLSRDRTVRVWSPKRGCVASKVLALSLGRDALPQATPASGSKPHLLFDEERQNLIKVFSADPSGVDLYLLAFVPTLSSATSGGFFQLLKMEDDQLYDLGKIDCSASSAHCHLQDFIVVDQTLHVLWDGQGQSSIEKTPLDLTEFDGLDVGCVWKRATYPEEPELTPSYLDELLLVPGSLTDKFLAAIMRPGMFSTFTLRTAIDQYTSAHLNLPDLSNPHLRGAYSSLAENIAASVGCTVNLQCDPLTGALQYDKYWSALKRDWEGFIARCRDLERGARSPLALAVEGGKRLILVIERERVGCLVSDDEQTRSMRRLAAGMSANDDPSNLMEILWTLRTRLGREAVRLVENQVVAICHQEIACTLSDLIKDAADQIELREYLEEGLDAWINGRLQSVEDLREAVHSMISTLGVLDTVKEEVVEEVEIDLSAPQPPPTHSEWSKALISNYVASTIHARYEFALSIMALFLFLPDHNWSLPLLDEAFSVFRGIAFLRFAVRQVASPNAQFTTGDPDDDVVSRLGNMHVSSNSRSQFVPSYNLVHCMLVDCLHTPNIARAAHIWLDQTRLLESASPSRASAHEVGFCNQVAKLGYTETASQLLAWLPRTPGVTYLQAELLVRAGRGDDAAYLLEKVAARFTHRHGLRREDQDALKMLVDEPSQFAFYKHCAFKIFKDSWTHCRVSFAQLALSVANPNEDTSDLWDALIDGNTELCQYEEAYAALVSAPLDPLKGERILRLVYRMCEDNAVEKLMTFNFAGFSEEVQGALAYKARNVDPRGRPFYARILYSWFISRGDYRNAALHMYQRARKLENLLTDPSTLIALAEEQLEAYQVAINSLSLVDSKTAWIALPVQQEAGHEPRKRRKLAKHIPEVRYTSGQNDAEVIELADMHYEYALLSARLKIAREGGALLSVAGFLLPPHSVVLRLAQSNRFNYAMGTARSLNVDMSDLFAHLTNQCLKLARTPEVVLQQDTSDWLLTDKLTSWPGTPADRGWRYLRQSLERHDGLETDYKYSKTTLETILTFDRFWAPPPWLISKLEEHHHEYLIRVSLRYENLEAALGYTISLIHKADAQIAREATKSTSSTWLPYTLIDQVAAASDVNNLSPAAKVLRQQLQNDLKTRVKRMDRLTILPEQPIALLSM